MRPIMDEEQIEDYIDGIIELGESYECSYDSN